MKRELTCIVCPMGCKMEVTVTGDVVAVKGNTCKRGEEYEKNECLNPTRVITTTARTESGEVVAVKTSAPIPKDLIFPCMKIINNLKIQLPIQIGCVIIKNILDTGVDLVASANKE